MAVNPNGLKSAWECKFHQDCKRCAMRSQCITASTLSRDSRYHFLYVKGVRFPPNAAMLAGTEKHAEFLKELPTVEKYTLFQFEKDLRAGKKIELQELRICNPIWALRGIIDHFTIQLVNDVLQIRIIDLKSGWHKGYLYQIAAYAMMMRHPATRVAIEGRIPRGKTKPRIESFIMLPRFEELARDISIGIQIFGAKKIYEWKYMEANMITDFGQVMKMNVEKKLKNFRQYNPYGLYYLSEIPICKECFDKCGYYPTCSKAWPTNGKGEKQMHFGQRDLLISSKPTVKKRIK